MGWQIFAAVVFVLIVVYAMVVRKSSNIPSGVFLMSLLGVIIGLSVGALISLPLSRLEGPLGQWLPLVVNIFSVAIITTFFYNQSEQITRSLKHVVELINTLIAEAKKIRRHAPTELEGHAPIVLDTSAIIDGRIVDLSKTGFLAGKVIVPRFVLDELQNIADSEDTLRRTKGRRGLEVLNELKRNKHLTLEVVEDDFLSEVDVDSKIIKLAKKYQGRLMTVDYNLNRVAQIHNVAVLNINELSNALRPTMLPGETMSIKIIQTGKDAGQGVGYLEDGTMVVVENAGDKIGEQHEIVVTRVFQTIAGKMIFATLAGDKTKTLANG